MPLWSIISLPTTLQPLLFTFTPYTTSSIYICIYVTEKHHRKHTEPSQHSTVPAAADVLALPCYVYHLNRNPITRWVCWETCVEEYIAIEPPATSAMTILLFSHSTSYTPSSCTNELTLYINTMVSWRHKTWKMQPPERIWLGMTLNFYLLPRQER